MTEIHLKHPEHGIKIANLEEEAIADIHNGWQPYDPREAMPEPEPVLPPKRRRGRPRKTPLVE